MLRTELNPSEAEALVGGYHGDAFRILGPHLNGDGGFEVRAFLPQAVQADVLPADSEPVSMQRALPQGLYVASVKGAPRPYRLRVHNAAGEISEFDDPYRFPPLISDFDLHLHAEGTQYQSYLTMGAHLTTCGAFPGEHVAGVRFAVWAPNAEVVSLVGDFNDWDSRRNPMRQRDGGVWEIFIPGIGPGAPYKYSVRSRHRGYQQQKADPYAFFAEVPPKSASVVCDLSAYQWQDGEWMESRAARDLLRQPVTIYEVHLESWLRGPRNEWLTYRELAHTLVKYVTRLGYTHIELLPVMEHPFSGSWGYQVTGYYAPTSRFGAPQDFMYFVDCCHRAGVGVLVDWVPAHFPKDAHGLAYFDGTALYEHEDPRKGEHKDWGTLIFNFARNEVRTFLISNALFWLEQYHIDGLRVDAVASMLYLDYSRKSGEWVPNIYGGNENLEAIDFLRKFNELAHRVPGAITVAEESTAFSGVSRPVYLNGLGFTMKWNMGWMHDMLEYFSKDPVYRKFSHQNITFSMLYAFTENFVQPISHDEVVHGKRSLLGKMPGDEWQRFANARAFLSYMYAHPGKKLLFMGCEIGQYEEWRSDSSVRWDLLAFDYHRKLQDCVGALNRFYRSQPALYEVDFQYPGFEWLDFRDYEASVICFARFAEDRSDFLVFCCNFTPVPRPNYRIGVPEPGVYREVFNSDSAEFGGSGVSNPIVETAALPLHGREQSFSITLPPLAVVAFKKVG